MMLFEFFTQSWGRNLLVGALSTIQISAGAYILGIVIGFLGALGKLYGGSALRAALEIYTTLIRAVPELVLILLLYYAGIDLLNRALASFGYNAINVSGLLIGIAVLGIVQGAYSTEVMRGAIQAVPNGQFEAARAFGMPSITLFRRIMLPAMIPNALPGMANLWLTVIKDSALLAVVGYSELALVTRQAAGATHAYLFFFLLAAAAYLCLTLFSNIMFTLIERTMRHDLHSREG